MKAKTSISKMERVSLCFISFFIFHFSFSIPLKAQRDTTEKRKISGEYMKYKYMFQGKIISERHNIRIKTSENTSSNYNFYLIQVQKVIKGEIKNGTIEIICGSDRNIYYDNGEIQPIISSDRDPNDYIPPGEGIYFSYKNYGGILKDSSDTNTNSKSLEFDGAIPLSKGELVKQKRGISRYFSTLSDFYNYISANYGLKIEDK